MIFAKRTILGLAIDELGISVAQIALGRRPRVERLARFELPAQGSLEDPGRVGETLRTFLRTHHFTAHTARLGVPARWVIAQERELPPTDAEGALAMLRLQAERFAVDDMVFDVAGPLPSGAASRVMMIGLLKKQLDRIEALCEAAGLKLVGVEPTVLAIARQVEGAGEPVLLIGEQGAELAWRHQGAPLMIKHLVGAGDALATASSVGQQVRRMLMMRPASVQAPQTMLTWRSEGASEAELAALSEQSGMRARHMEGVGRMPVQIPPSALNGAAGKQAPQSFLPAVAVALPAPAAPGEAVNFLVPRLAAPAARRFSRTAALAILAGLVIVLGLAGLYYDVNSRETQAAAMEARLDAMQPELKAAKQRLARFGYGRRYFDQRPPVLDCLSDIARAFGRDSSIWATGFSFSENRKGTLHGKASNQPAVLALRDRLEKDKSFANLQLLDLREGTGASRDVSFSMSFIYTGGAHAQ